MNREKGGDRVRERGAQTRVGGAGGVGPVGGGCQGFGRGERREGSVGIRRRLAKERNGERRREGNGNWKRRGRGREWEKERGRERDIGEGEGGETIYEPEIE
jgi:hypothetical protein